MKDIYKNKRQQVVAARLTEIRDELSFTGDRSAIKLKLKSGKLAVGKEGAEQQIATVQPRESEASILMAYNSKLNTFVDSGYRLVDGKLYGIVHTKDLDDYVKKEQGKSLSDNNYSNDEKEALADLRLVVPVQSITIDGQIYEGANVELPLRNFFSSKGGISNQNEGNEAVTTSIAIGANNKVNHSYSAAFGVDLVSGRSYQLVAGVRNEVVEDAVLVLGAGSNAEAKTVFHVGLDGKAYSDGKVLATSEELADSNQQLMTRIGELEELVTQLAGRLQEAEARLPEEVNDGE